VLAEHRAQGRLGKLARRHHIVLDLDGRLLGIDDPEIDDRVHPYRDVVAADHVLRRDVEDQGPEIHPHHLLDDRDEQDQARPLHRGEAPEGEDDSALIFAQDLDRRHQEQDRDQDHRQVETKICEQVHRDLHC
jgi:hypothetical protein